MPRAFHAYSDHLRAKYGFRLQKLSVNAGFSCPNRDGSKGLGGCVFCNNEAFNPSYCQSASSIREQLEEGKKFHAWRYRHVPKYIAYFQTYSNTYAPLDVLKTRYREALETPDVVGLAIGTRPDCVNDEILDYLAELSKTKHIHLEMGIESCFDKSLAHMNRGHDFATAQKAFEAAAKRGLFTGTHLILGLPWQSRDEDLQQAAMISKLPVHTLKLHQLQIIKNTALEKEYAAHPENFSFFTADAYVDFVIDFLERLSPDVLMERFAGEAPARFQAGPVFNLRSDRILQMIEERMAGRQTRQGRLWQGNKA